MVLLYTKLSNCEIYCKIKNKKIQYIFFVNMKFEIKVSKVKKAFSILELLIVMGVISSIAMLGIFGLLNVQYSIELNNYYAQLNVFQTTIKNYAVNSFATNASGSKNSADYYAFQYSENKFQNLFCDKVGTSTIECNTIGTLELVTPSFIELTFNPISCTFFAYEKFSSRVLAIENNGLIFSGQCTIIVKHRNLAQSKSITFDFENNSVTKSN